MIEILLVDDHPSVGEGTKVLIEKEEDMKVTVASDEFAALKLVESHSFDVFMFDLHMPNINGLELSKRILGKNPEAIIVIYTGDDLRDSIYILMDSGVTSLISKTATQEQIVTGIRCAIRREVVLPIDVIREFNRGRGTAREPFKAVEPQPMTTKEKTILDLINKGKSNKEIARELLISQRSLEYALTHLFQKLHVRSRIEAVKKAKESGIIAAD
jgi:two-component system, NarL family, competent response regulator ComA